MTESPSRSALPAVAPRSTEESSASSEGTATAAGNAVVVRRLVEEVWGLGRFNLVPALVADVYVGHLAIGDHYGPEGLRIEVAAYRAAFPDLTATVDDLIAVADTVVRRFTLRGTHARPLLGIPATGRSLLLSGIAIDRLAGGRLVESWVQVDALPLLQDPIENGR